MKANEIITTEEREVILDNMERLLDEYDYECTTEALNLIIDTWAENKADLIAHFKNHPNYLQGKFMIVFSKDYARKTDENAIKSWIRWLQGFNVSELSDVAKEMLEYENEKYCASYNAPFIMYQLCYYDNYANQFINANFCNNENKKYNDIFRFREGMKTSRCINKICKWLGVDKHPDYNREFAKLADALNPIKVTRHTIISLNPIDYLTMSFGNSWASCHTIDKENRRGMPNSYEGQYSSGTISYMLDATSMVFYTVDQSYNGSDFFFEPKINRCMFHYAYDKLVQGRLYPQSCDYGCSELYTDVRGIVQNVISICYDKPNFWSAPLRMIDYVISGGGTNYEDYFHFDTCNIRRFKGSDDNRMVEIGHAPICIECGCEHDTEDNINHCSSNVIYCTNCGCVLDEDDDYTHYFNDDPYCEDCCEYCECCGEWYPSGKMRWLDEENKWVCDDCFDEFYCYCIECDEYYHETHGHFINGNFVCDDCYDRNYVCCDNCGCVVKEDDTTIMPNGNCLCDDCYEKVTESEEEE